MQEIIIYWKIIAKLVLNRNKHIVMKIKKSIKAWLSNECKKYSLSVNAK